MNYPLRYRQKTPIQFGDAMIPDAIIRKKAKCWSQQGGLICDRDHVHERLLVDTSRLPLHWSDRLLSRAWVLAKGHDPWPSREL